MHRTHGHRRYSRGLWLLALLAWLGMVSMGMAQGMSDVSGMQVHAAGMPHVSQQTPQDHPVPALDHHSGGHCGMGIGCHCGSVCYGVMVPQTLALAGPAPAIDDRIDFAPRVPAGLGDPPLHPPSI